jgi:hypothetical protein
MINAASIKFTKTTVPASKGMRNSGMADEIFYANGIEICRNTMYMELYATIQKGGMPSNLRGKSKKSCDRKWNVAGLEKLLGTRSFKIRSKGNDADFYESYPDTTWGDPGTPITLTAVKAQVEGFIARNDIKLSNVFERWSVFLLKVKQPLTMDLYRQLAILPANITTDYFGTIKSIVSVLLSNFGTISGYMSYSPDEAKKIQELIGTPNQKFLDEKLYDIFSGQTFDMVH